MPDINLHFYGDYWKDVNKYDGASTVILDTDENDKGKEVNETMTKKDEKEEIKEVKKQEAGAGEANPENPDKGEEGAEMKACMKKHMADGESMAEAKKACKVEMKDEEEEEGKKAEDVKDTKVEKAEEKKEEKKEEVKPADVHEADDVAQLLKSIISKIDTVLAKSEGKKEEVKTEKADDSAPAEGATPVKEEAPKEEAPVVEAPKEEAPKEGASQEGAEVQKAVGDLSQKIEGSLAKVTETLGAMEKSLKGMEDRVKKLEEQPLPSKVLSTKIMSKNGEGKLSAADQEKLERVEKRLGELEDLKKTNMPEYQSGRYWEEAGRLLDERDSLHAKESWG